MTNPVLITRRVPTVSTDALTHAGVAFDIHDSDTPLDAAALRRAVAGRRGVVCLIPDHFDARLLEAISPDCRIIATISVGHDHIDVPSAARMGIVVTNTPDVLTETTADLTWALMLAVARRLGEAERIVRAGRWTGWGLMQFLGTDVHGATLGIVGAGRIGMAVARRAAGFGMRVLCASRKINNSRRGAEAQKAPIEFAELDTLLRESDFVSLHVSLTPATHHLIGPAQFAMMKPTAILINTSRGPVVDETALIAALRDGRIAGAGLDVYEHEPRVPAELLAMENVVLLPHIGSASRATRERMSLMAVQSVIDVLTGRTPRNALRV